MSPAEREARQMIADKKAAKAAERAYNAASKTEPAPMANEESPAANRLSRRLKAMMDDTKNPEMDVMGNQTGYSKGGKVSSASKRADGIAQRGKTRGKII